MKEKASALNARNEVQELLYKSIRRLVNLLIKFEMKPNTITTIGFIINIIAAIVFILGAEISEKGDLFYIGLGGGLILFAGLFDVLDGQVARHGKKVSKFGALYDSVFDRYSELVMFLGICYYLVSQHYFISSIAAFIALIGSIMVSYIRARAEGLGVECKNGLMQRPERIIIIGLSGLVCGIVAGASGGNQKFFYINWLHFHVVETISIFIYPLAIVAILANVTAISRLNYCRKQLNGNDANN